MEWKVFFAKIKFLEHIKLFIIFLIITGLILVSNGSSKLILAVLIFLSALILNYFKTSGILGINLEKGYSKRKYLIADISTTLVIASIFGYAFVKPFKYTGIASFIYIMLWIFSWRHIYIKLKKFSNLK